jgi:hypothetical protein
MTQHDEAGLSANVARRAFLSRSAGMLAGASVLSATAVSSADAATPACWKDDAIDVAHGEFGVMRLLVKARDGVREAVPIAVEAAQARGSVDLRGKLPAIRIGEDARGILLTPTGIRLPNSPRVQAWSKASVASLLRLLAADTQLQRDAFLLRAAAFTLYPEYLRRSGATAPKTLATRQSRAAGRLARFGKKSSGATDTCRVETLVEETERVVRRNQDVVLTAAQQFQRCTDACFDRHLDRGRNDVIGFAVCEAGCIATGFVDLVVGTLEVLDTIVETVTRQVLVCAVRPLPDHLPGPFRGWAAPRLEGVNLAGAVGTQAAMPADVVAKAADIVVKMVKSLPGAIRCIAEGEWSITELSDVGVDVPGLGAVPLGVTVCMDHECAMKLLGAGLGADAFGIISSLVALASGGGIEAAVVAAGVTGAAVAGVTQAVLALLAVLIVLMVHLLIVAGQIVTMEALGLIDAGVCITHPSLPVILAGVANPLAGLVALGNMPLLVTPRG